MKNDDGSIANVTTPVTPDDTRTDAPDSAADDLAGAIADKRRLAVELRAKGKSYRQIARELAISPMTVQRYCFTEATKKAVELRVPVTSVTVSDVRAKLLNLAPDCVETLNALRRSSTKDDVKLRAAIDLLDRAGFAPVAKLVQLSVIEEMSGDQLLTGLESLLAQITSRTQCQEQNSNIDAAPAINVPNVAPATTVPTHAIAQPVDNLWITCAQPVDGGVARESLIQGAPLDTSEQKSNLHVQQKGDSDAVES